MSEAEQLPVEEGQESGGIELVFDEQAAAEEADDVEEAEEDELEEEEDESEDESDSDDSDN
ncbi:hypothetical protein [Paenibacillus daejeonensis]|uniref:hypothetical protein n=1 Tax=Paenibacillus daejeonensis TaxID=135193 RepID=UPI000369D7CE|nr:hypothetical protein [Paenibacillus daejeonensis]